MDLVSVVIAAYNHEKYVKDAINSVLNQTYKNIELIVEDDCSTDNTVKEIKKIKDKRLKTVFSKKNKGPVRTMNHLLSMCKGDYIAILGSDDIWYPEKLEKQLKCFKNKKIGAVFSMMDIIDENGKIDKESDVYNLFNKKNMTRGERMRYFYDYGNHLCHPTSIITREALENVGYYNYIYRQLHDCEYWIRLINKYDIYILDEKLIGYRRVSDGKNLSSATNEHILMHVNEEVSIIQNLFKNIDDKLFIDGFKDLFKNKNSSTKNELICEKFLILLNLQIAGNNDKYIALNYISTLDNTNEIIDLLESKYDYKLLDFYKDNMVVHNFYNIDILTNNNKELLKFRKKSNEYDVLKEEYNSLSSEYKKAIDEINNIHNSKSWKITKPLRIVMGKAKNEKNKED